MVHISIKPSASSERQEVINWLKAHNYPALPVAPAQSAWKHPKVSKAHPDQGVWAHCPLTADRQPIQLFTGKNPSYLDKAGVPHLINHREYQKRLPNKNELAVWFKHQSNGVGTLGGWNNTAWLDFDVKQFSSQQECDAAVSALLERPELQQTFIERSHSGGWRIGVKVKQKPNFTNFSLTQKGGAHVGEALYIGRFTVLAPTIGPSGNPYRSVQRLIPVEVESLESIGIYSTKKGRGQGGLGGFLDASLSPPASPAPLPSQSPVLSPDSIPLELLGNDTSRDILHGNCPTGDRSEALTTAIREWYGWENWGRSNGIQISGDATTLSASAGSSLGLDSDRINRILKTIEPSSCQPAALYRGGEESCWKKILRMSRTTFERQCPTHIKDSITQSASTPTDSDGNGNGSGGGRRGGGCKGFAPGGGDSDSDPPKLRRVARYTPNTPSRDLAAIKRQIKDILIRDLPPSELLAEQIRIRADNPGISERECEKLFETIAAELELEESRSEVRSEVDNLLKLGDQSLNLGEFLPTDLAEPLNELAKNLNIRPEVCLTSLLVAASSLHKTQTELVIHKGQGFSVPPTIFAGLVSESGQKKSPILKAIIKKPLSVLQREKRVAYSKAEIEYEKDIADWDKCKSEERSSKFPNGKPKQPTQRLYYFTNSTGEGLLYQFQAHPDKALLALVDELVGLFASQNKYSGGRGSDRQDILSAFDGTGATVLRASGTKADIDGLLLSICGTIQPEVLKRLMRDCSDPDGQWARFLFVNQPLAAATLGDDDGSSVDLSERLLSYYRAIDGLPHRVYRLSRPAYLRYQPVYNQLEQLRVSHPLPGMRAVYSKMEGYIGRLALNLHVIHELSCGKTLPDEEIPLSILECAIALAKFYIGQVKLIHANCSASLGDIAPHLAKIVELSKRMDATTGISWIKAKVVQTGYDSRHRPRPNAVRSWFRELEALGLGSTRSTGIRLEYSWKLPDLPFDDSRTEQQQKVEKSGEKWITSPPTETTQNQWNQEKVEKVDNPTCSLTVSLSTSDEALDNNGPESVAELETKARRQELKDRVSDWNSYEEEETQEIKEANSCLSRVSPGTPLLSKSQSLITNPHSTYPLSGCDDDIAPEEAVDTLSTFSPPVDSISTIPAELELSEVSTGSTSVDVDLTAPTVELNLGEVSTGSTSVDVDLIAPAVELNLGEVSTSVRLSAHAEVSTPVGAGLVAPVREELQEARRDFSSTSPAAPALPQKWKIVISITVPPENFSNSHSEAKSEGEDGQCPTELTQVLLTVIEGERELSVLGGSVVFLRKVREALALRIAIALSLDNCPAHYEKGNLDEESRAKNGDYTPN